MNERVVCVVEQDVLVALEEMKVGWAQPSVVILHFVPEQNRRVGVIDRLECVV